MTNIHINEIELEKLARSMAEGVTNEVIYHNSHLQTCNACRKKFDFFVKFYITLNEELNIHQRQNNERVEHFIEQLVSSNIICLKPYNAQPDYNSIGSGKNSYVLAAQTVAEEVPRYKTIATFASEQVPLLVKINEDTENKLYHLFVLSEKEDHRSHILIGISEENGEKILIPTNSDGYAELHYSIPINWRNATLVLITPSEVISFNDIEKFSEGKIKDMFKFILKTEEHKLTFNFLPETRYFPHHILLVYENQKHIYKQVEGTTVTFTLEADKRIREIKLFV